MKKLFYILVGVLCCLIKQVQSIIQVSQNIGQSNQQLYSVSSGLQHLSMITGDPANSSTKKLIMYNVVQNTGVILAQNTSNLSKIYQAKGINTLQQNSYIVQYTVSFFITSLIWKANLTDMATSQAGTEISSKCFGNDSMNMYELYPNGGSCQLLKRGFSTNRISMDNITGHNCYDVCYSNQIVYALVYQPTNKSGLIKFYNASTNSVLSTYPFSTSVSYSKAFLKVSNLYYALAHGPIVTIFSKSNNGSICNLTLTADVYDIKITDNWIYVTTLTYGRQYTTNTCMFFGQTPTSVPKFIQFIQPTANIPNDKLYLWSPNSTAIEGSIVKNGYPCNGCTCSIGYTLDTVTSTCYYGGSIPPLSNTTTNINLTINTNITNNTNITVNNSIPNNSIPANNSTSNNSASNNSIVVPPILYPIIAVFNDSSFCYVNKFGMCEIYCDYRCLICQPFPFQGICTICGINRQQNQNDECIIVSIFVIIFTITANLVKTFRTTSTQGIFFLLDNLELYIYHKTQYTGIIKDIFDQLNFIEDKKWSFIPFQFITDWTQRPYDENSPYIAFTNQKYLQIQRKDSTLLQATKAYYSLTIPVLFVSFFFMNRLFYVLFQYKISSSIRIYSFWLQFFVISILSNSTKLSYLSFCQLKLIFSFHFNNKIMHYVSINLIGVFIIALLSLFFLSSSLYGHLSKYFLVNTYRINLAHFITFLRFSIRPIIESAIHIFLFNFELMQLISLSLIQFFNILLLFFIQLKFSMFKSKFIFICESIISFSLLSLNMLLILKHFYLQTIQSQLNQLIQQCISTFSIFAGFITIFCVLYSLLISLIQQIYFIFIKTLIHFCLKYNKKIQLSRTKNVNINGKCEKHLLTTQNYQKRIFIKEQNGISRKLTQNIQNHYSESKKFERKQKSQKKIIIIKLITKKNIKKNINNANK